MATESTQDVFCIIFSLISCYHAFYFEFNANYSSQRRNTLSLNSTKPCLRMPEDIKLRLIYFHRNIILLYFIILYVYLNSVGNIKDAKE